MKPVHILRLRYDTPPEHEGLIGAVEIGESIEASARISQVITHRILSGKNYEKGNSQ